MVTLKNVKSIGLKVRFQGQGCVNWDGTDENVTKPIDVFHFADLKNHESGKQFSMRENVKVAKRVYCTTEDGNPGFLYKVGGKCIGRAIFEREIPGENQAMAAVKPVMYRAIAGWAYIMKGYMFGQGKSNAALRKKSGFELGDAIEVGKPRTIAVFETNSTKCTKEVSNSDNAKKSTSFYSTENVGNNVYESNGFINLGELQFIPDDPFYDRIALGLFDKCKEETIYLEQLAKNFPSMNGASFKYYYNEGSYTQDEIGERGILLSTDAVNDIIHRFLKAISIANIQRRYSSLSTESIIIEVVYDGGRKEIDLSKENIDDFYFEYALKYFECDEEKILANREKFGKFKESKPSNKSKAENKENTEPKGE